MSSRQSTPVKIDATASEASATPLGSTAPSVFGRMMGTETVQKKAIRDTCKRPTPTYNTKYNPFEKPSPDVPGGYSPYKYLEPLFDDQLVITIRIPKYYTLAPPLKRPCTAWV